MLLILLLVSLYDAKIIIKGVVQMQDIQCCEKVPTHIVFDEPMKEVPQIVLTVRALEYDNGPIAFFSSLNEITKNGFTVSIVVPKGFIKVIAYEYLAINQDDIEFGFFNIDALGNLKTSQSGDASIPLFMKFKRHFVEEPLVQVFIVGFDCETKQVSFEVSPFSVAQNGVTLKINKYGTTVLSRLQVSYVATEQSDSLAKLVTHTQAKSANIGYKFLELEEDDVSITDEKKAIELIQISGINGLRFMTPPVSFIWQGDKIEPSALNVNLRITLDKGNQAVLGLYYFEMKPYHKCPIIYTECGFRGNFVYVCKNIPDFERVFQYAKSVMIPAKSYLTVFQDTTYTGVMTKLTESQDCLKDWFDDVPVDDISGVQTLLQINKYKKNKGSSDMSFLQKKPTQSEYWQSQGKTFGIKMPQWYSYKQDGSMEKDTEIQGQRFEKIEVEDEQPQNEWDQAQMTNDYFLEDHNVLEDKDQFIHIDEQALF